jgi:hypothetical protein
MKIIEIVDMSTFKKQACPLCGCGMLDFSDEGITDGKQWKIYCCLQCCDVIKFIEKQSINN